MPQASPRSGRSAIATSPSAPAPSAGKTPTCGGLYVTQPRRSDEEPATGRLGGGSGVGAAQLAQGLVEDRGAVAVRTPLADVGEVGLVRLVLGRGRWVLAVA